MKSADSRHAAQFVESDMLSYVIVHVTYDRSKSSRSSGLVGSSRGREWAS
jgi:hypothetical protein